MSSLDAKHCSHNSNDRDDENKINVMHEKIRNQLRESIAYETESYNNGLPEQLLSGGEIKPLQIKKQHDGDKNNVHMKELDAVETPEDNPGIIEHPLHLYKLVGDDAPHNEDAIDDDQDDAQHYQDVIVAVNTYNKVELYHQRITMAQHKKGTETIIAQRQRPKRVAAQYAEKKTQELAEHNVKKCSDDALNGQQTKRSIACVELHRNGEMYLRTSRQRMNGQPNK